MLHPPNEPNNATNLVRFDAVINMQQIQFDDLIQKIKTVFISETKAFFVGF